MLSVVCEGLPTMKWALEKLSALAAWKTPIATFVTADPVLMDLTMPWWGRAPLSAQIIFQGRKILWNVSVTWFIGRHHRAINEAKRCTVLVFAWENLFSSKENKLLERPRMGSSHCSCVRNWNASEQEVWKETALHLLRGEVWYTCSSSAPPPSYFLLYALCKVICTSVDPKTRRVADPSTKSYDINKNMKESTQRVHTSAKVVQSPRLVAVMQEHAQKYLRLK